MEAGSLLIEELKKTSKGREELKFRDTDEIYTKMRRKEASEVLLNTVNTIKNEQKLLINRSTSSVKLQGKATYLNVKNEEDSRYFYPLKSLFFFTTFCAIILENHTEEMNGRSHSVF